VVKAWEGIIPRWKKHGRELFLGVKNNGREKFREGKIPYPERLSFRGYYASQEKSPLIGHPEVFD